MRAGGRIDGAGTVVPGSAPAFERRNMSDDGSSASPTPSAAPEASAEQPSPSPSPTSEGLLDKAEDWASEHKQDLETVGEEGLLNVATAGTYYGMKKSAEEAEKIAEEEYQHPTQQPAAMPDVPCEAFE